MAMVDLASYSCGIAAHIDWLGPKVGGMHLALFYIHQKNTVNHWQWLCYDHSTINIAMSYTSFTLAAIDQ